MDRARLRRNNIKLNDDQLKAVKHDIGPLLIIAGAGTGKTTVITQRIKSLISKKKAKPDEILALTFTDKAAREMEERVDIALPYGYTQMWIMTFHSFGERVLRQHALEIGLDSGYRLMTEAESVLFFRKNIFKYDLEYFRPLGNPTKFVEAILQHFHRLKDEDITPKEYQKWVNKMIKAKNKKTSLGQDLDLSKYQELAKAYKKYEDMKKKKGLMDFSDLVSNTLKLFRKRKIILSEYHKRFKYILVDEFQDTNIAQNELACLLAGEDANIVVVGDDDQAIYRWRGAAVSNIIQFRKRFKKAKTVVLQKNYRSNQQLLDSAYELIQYNNPDRLEVKENIIKKLIAKKNNKDLSGKKIKFLFADRVEEEAEKVVSAIKDLKTSIKDKDGNDKYKWKDFAILVRANAHADPFSRALFMAGVPFQFLGPGMLFRQAEIKDLIAYLKILIDFTDSVAGFRVLSMDIFDISAKDILAINNFGRKMGLSLFEALEMIIKKSKKDTKEIDNSDNYQDYIPVVSKDGVNKLGSFYDMYIRHTERVKKDTAGQILYYFLQDTGMLEKLTSYETIKEEKRVLNISKFFNKLKTYEIDHEDASVPAIVDWIEMSQELGESPLSVDTDWTEVDAVNILTVHASKGLEFPIVIMVNLVTNRFPTIRRREKIPIPDDLVKEILPEGDYHVQEERRLYYVGLTRAKDFCYLSASRYYGEGKRERKTSPFVIETLGIDAVEKAKIKSRSKPVQLTLSDWEKGDILKGDDLSIQIDYLSYSQIRTYKTCPLQYKYRYVIKIPVPQSAAASFGSTIHISLQRFYERLKKNENTKLKDLLKIFKDNWIPVGYGNRKYEAKMKNRGIRMLTGYYETFFDKNTVPLYLEQLFHVKIGKNLKVGGKIDRVDKRGEKLEIIDYKTGRRPTDREIKKNLQMTIYAMAAHNKGIYDKKVEDVILTFYFLEKREKVSSVRKKDDLIKAKESILEIAREINQGNFAPRVGKWCDFCDFRLICEAWK